MLADIENNSNLDDVEKAELLEKAKNELEKEPTRKDRAPEIDVEDVSNENVSKPSGESESGSGSNQSSESAEDKGEGDEED